MRPSRELEILAVAGHGAAVATHGLAATYHWALDHKLSAYAVIHLLLAGFSVASLGVHLCRLNQSSEQS